MVISITMPQASSVTIRLAAGTAQHHVLVPLNKAQARQLLGKRRLTAISLRGY